MQVFINHVPLHPLRRRGGRNMPMVTRAMIPLVVFVAAQHGNSLPSHSITIYHPQLFILQTEDAELPSIIQQYIVQPYELQAVAANKMHGYLYMYNHKKGSPVA